MPTQSQRVLVAPLAPKDGSRPADKLPARSASIFPNVQRLGHLRSDPLLPLSFPTLEHLDERLSDIRTRAGSVEGLQRETILRWRTAARSFLGFLRADAKRNYFLAGDYRLQTQILESWIASLRDRGVSRTTIATYWHSLDAQVRRIQQMDGMLNPLTLMEAPKPATPLPRSLTRSQAERLMTYVRNRVWATPLEAERNLCAIGLMLFAGLRRGEVLRLHVADCNITAGTLTVRNAKGKNGGRTRTSYMTPQLQHLIASYLDLRSQTNPERTHPELLTSVVGDRAMGLTCLSRLFIYIRRGTNIHVTPHMLRHTYAMLLRQAGCPDRVSMDLLGHRSLAMLQRYSHVFDGEHQREAARLYLDVDLPTADLDHRAGP